MARPTITPEELRGCRPEHAIGSEMAGDLVVLLRPRFVSGPLAWWLQPHLRRPYFRVRLDAVGSFIWNRCDGQTTVGQIATGLEERFGDEVKPAMDRLRIFLRQLQDGQMIRVSPAE